MNNLRRSLRSLVPILVIAALLGLLAVQPVAAANSPWKAFGPGGGTVIKLAIDPKSPKTVYALVAGFDLYSDNAIFKSTDGAVTWTRLSRGLPVVPELPQPPQDLALDIAHPKDLFTVLCLRSGGHVYRSRDHGVRWTRQTPAEGISNAGSGVSARSCHLAIDPNEVSTIYLAMGTRLLSSQDGGVHWTEVLNTPTEILALWADRGIYVGTAEGGGLWVGATGGPFSRVAGPSSVQAIATNRPRHGQFRVYAASGSAVYLNRGTSFNAWLWQGDAGGTVTALAVNLQSPLVVYAAHEHGVSVSRDGGLSWTLVSQGLPSVRRTDGDPPSRLVKVLALAIDPRQPGTVYAGTERAGVYQILPGGQRWQAGDQQGLIGATIYHVLFDPFHPGTACAVENGLGGLWCSTPSGNWTRKSTTLSRGFLITEIEFDPSTPNALVVLDRFDGDVVRLYRSLDSGVTWTEISHLDGPTYTVYDMAVVNQGVLLLATQQGVLRSTDEGQSWTNAGGIGALSLVPDPADLSTVYLIALPQSGGGVYRSRDAGRSWTPILGQALAIVPVADPGLPGTVYALAGPQADTTILRSLDRGDSWTETGHFSQDFVTNLAADRLSPGTLYLGTSHLGVYRSTDGGAAWAPVPGLQRLGSFGDYFIFAHPSAPNTFVAMPVEGGGLFIATFPPG